jgi:hypothetical protein
LREPFSPTATCRLILAGGRITRALSTIQR